ncbi:hypothetical protein Ae505Ps2_0394c [Pseudonocardia sp. Ae505_Ps2]|nr:hypothetical protein Ae505Ps2_0394c [Pseudonocardia sp. Ae505_Ps2]
MLPVARLDGADGGPGPSVTDPTGAEPGSDPSV